MPVLNLKREKKTKKLYLGLVLILTGAMITAGALIGGGAVMGGRNAYGYFSDIFDSYQASLFVTIGMLLFIVGSVMSITEAYKKEMQ
jgi:hypothetical protein